MNYTAEITVFFAHCYECGKVISRGALGLAYHEAAWHTHDTGHDVDIVEG